MLPPGRVPVMVIAISPDAELLREIAAERLMEPELALAFASYPTHKRHDPSPRKRGNAESAALPR